MAVTQINSHLTAANSQMHSSEPLQSPQHIVVTVHGIRTIGRWQERLQELIQNKDSSICTLSYKYGFFSSLEYLSLFLRWHAAFRFRRELCETVAKYPDARIDIVAHSFGTYLVGWALMGAEKAKRPKIHTIILASSVLSTGFQWRNLIDDGTVKRVINECAICDVVLYLSPFTGASGIFGHTHTMVGDKFRQNWYKFGHSGYFKSPGRSSDEFMIRRWLPVLTSTKLPEQIDERPEGWYIGLLMFFRQPAKALLLMVLIAAAITVNSVAFLHFDTSAHHLVLVRGIEQFSWATWPSRPVVDTGYTERHLANEDAKFLRGTYFVRWPWGHNPWGWQLARTLKPVYGAELAHYLGNDRLAVERLKDGIEDVEYASAEEVLRKVVIYGAGTKEALEVATAAAHWLPDKDPHGWIRSAGAVALWRLGVKAEAVAVLRALVEHPEGDTEDVRVQALEAISRTTAEAPEMLILVGEMVHLDSQDDEDWRIRRAAARTLGVFRTTPAAANMIGDLIREGTSHPDEWDQSAMSAALDSLALLGSGADQGEELVEQVLTSICGCVKRV